MNGFREILFLDATVQAEKIRQKEVQPVELLEAAIECIEHLNPALNAVVTPMYEQARAAIAADLPTGPFTGVPFLLKDLLASYGGVRLTSGSKLLRNFVPDYDSELVVRLKKAGLVIIGKTNTPEFGILPTTEPELFGESCNPWDMERTTGGSSGGSAAAVAAGIVAMAHANDGGGSIRIPASCCGLFGLKPTRARNPLGPIFGDIRGGLVAEHVVTRSVRDSAALLDAVSGPDIGDPYPAPPPKRPFLEEVGVYPGRLRIAFTVESPAGGFVHPDCIRAVYDTAALCSDLGHEVEEKAPKLDGSLILQAFMTLWSSGCAATLDGMERTTGKAVLPEQVELLTWALYEMGQKVTASDYLLAWQFLQQVSRDIARFFVDYDLLLAPTLAEPPVPLGTFDPPPADPLRAAARAGQFVPFTQLANITGQPAMSLPLAWNKDGLPIGTHFMGRFGDEATLFRLAAQLEMARPWQDRWPTVSIRAEKC